MSGFKEIEAAAPIVVIIAAAVGISVLAYPWRKERDSSHSLHFTVVALLGLGCAFLALLRADASQSGFGGVLVVDGLALVFGTTALLGATLSLFIAIGYTSRYRLRADRFHVLILLGTTGTVLVAVAGDLLTLLVGVEVVVLGTSLLSGIHVTLRTSQEAALKYFCYGSFASGFALFGIALLYGEVGRATGDPSVHMTALRAAVASGEVSNLTWVGVAFVIGGFAFKLAATPFHMWTPDVYEGAPPPVAAFMAAGLKAAGFAGLLRLTTALLPNTQIRLEALLPVFEVIAVLTFGIGNLLAIRQRSVKRILTYSSIAHTGYMLLGVVAYLGNPGPEAAAALSFYLFGYVAMSVGAFGIVLAMEYRDPELERPARLAGMARAHPALGFAMLVFLLSLAGVPPTAGFFGKLVLFGAAIDAGRWEIVVLAAIASVVGAYTYFRVIAAMYMEPETRPSTPIRSGWLHAGLWGCVVFSVGLGILPESYLAFARTALGAWFAL